MSIKQTHLLLICALFANTSFAGERAMDESANNNITPDVLSTQIETIKSLDLTDTHPQKDGSKTFLLSAESFQGVRSDRIYAYVTPISHRIAGVESFTNIEEHHCNSFMDVVKEGLGKYGLVELKDEAAEGNVLAARSKDSSVVMFAECIKDTEQTQFVSVMYHMPTQHLLTRENNEIVTTTTKETPPTAKEDN